MPDRRDTFGMLLLSLCAALAAWKWGGLIPLGEGLGTDGRIYASLAMDYFGQIARGVWSYSPDYYFQRSLPPFFVYLTLKALSLPADPPHLIAVFRAWNLAALLGCVFFYQRIARLLAFGRALSWAGYFALFWGVNNLFVPFYYPTLTDIFGFLASLGLFWAYLAQAPMALFLFALLSGFIWPVLLPLGLALFVFPVGEALAEPSRFDRLVASARPWLRPALALGAGLVLMAAVAWVARSRFGPKYGLPLAGIELWSVRGMAGLLSLGLYEVFAAWVLLGHEALWRPVAMLGSRSRMRVALALAAVFFVKLLVRSVVPHGSSSNLIAVVMTTTLSATQPFLFLAKHPLFFGPAILLVYLLFFPVLHRLAGMGLGAWLFLAPFLQVGFDLESRHHLVAVAPLVLGALLLLSRREGFSGSKALLLVGPASVLFGLLWFWVRIYLRSTSSELYHQFIWGRPDWLSLSLLALCFLGYVFSLASGRRRSVA